MTILVVGVDYPNNDGGVALACVRTRNLYYVEQGEEVDVLNFSTSSEISSIWEGKMSRMPPNKHGTST